MLLIILVRFVWLFCIILGIRYFWKRKKPKGKKVLLVLLIILLFFNTVGGQIMIPNIDTRTETIKDTWDYISKEAQDIDEDYQTVYVEENFFSVEVYNNLSALEITTMLDDSVSFLWNEGQEDNLYYYISPQYSLKNPLLLLMSDTAEVEIILTDKNNMIVFIKAGYIGNDLWAFLHVLGPLDVFYRPEVDISLLINSIDFQ